jgi:hypothetical protein
MTENDYKFFQEAILDQSLDLSLMAVPSIDETV